MATTNMEMLLQLDDLARKAGPLARLYGHGGGPDSRPLWAFTVGNTAQSALLVAAGVHGDEPEGVLALLHWLEGVIGGSVPAPPYPVLALPCVCPSALAAGTRASGAGQDINRQFHSDGTPETAAVRHLLSSRPLFAIADFHTDLRASGFYLFELLHRDTPGVAEELRQMLTARGLPREPLPTYGGLVGHDGVLVPEPEQIARFGHDAPGLSLAEWGWHRGVRRAYVLEAPHGLEVEAGAQMHSAAWADLLALLAPLYPDAPPQGSSRLWASGK